MNWYLTVLKKYATFSGRAQRAEYWYFILFSTIASIILTHVTPIKNISIFPPLDKQYSKLEYIFSP